MSLIKIIKDTLDNSLVSINNQQKNFITHILETNPEVFHSIENDIKNIIEYNQITVSDVPKIINVISTIAHEHTILHELEKTNNTVFLAEFTINAIIDSTLFMVPNIEKELIKKAVDNSIELLAFFGNNNSTNNSSNDNSDEKCWLFKFC
jgi:hypothetical protein